MEARHARCLAAARRLGTTALNLWALASHYAVDSSSSANRLVFPYPLPFFASPREMHKANQAPLAFLLLAAHARLRCQPDRPLEVSRGLCSETYDSDPINRSAKLPITQGSR